MSSEPKVAWRYAVELDFHALSDDKHPIETTTLTYDTYKQFVPFREPLLKCFHHTVSSNERWLALAVGKQIDLYDLLTGEKTTLVGHTENIIMVQFARGKAETLVSSAYYNGDQGDQTLE